MEVSGELLAGGTAGAGVAGLGWWYLKSQLSKIDDLKDRIIRLETRLEDKQKECDRHQSDTSARLAEGNAKFEELTKKLDKTNEMLNQILGWFASRPNTSSQTMLRVPQDTV